jgi:replicative DNA helicase
MTNAAAPQNVMAERALLGAVLSNGEILDELRWVRPEAFYQHTHRYVWDAVTRLSGQGIFPDVVTVGAELDRSGALAEIGGTAYLARCISECESSLNALSYARLVEREWKRRELIAGATKLAQIAYAGGDAGPALAEIEQAQRGTGDGTAVDAGAIAPEVWESVAYPERQAARMIATGLPDWDGLMGGGLERGTLTAIMARPSMGKTALLVQIADYVSERGGTVAVFSLEMTRQQWILRTACRRARVSVLALKQGRVTDDQRGRVLEELAALTERRHLIIDDTPQTTDSARATCDRLRRGGGLDLVLADHLRLFADTGENENKRQGNSSWGLKRMAKALDVPVLCAVQLNRGVEQQASDKRPDLKDIRDSGEIEENVDTATALYRDSYYSENPLDHTAELINRKARDGERNARAKFVFLSAYMSFEPLAKGSEQ